MGKLSPWVGTPSLIGWKNEVSIGTSSAHPTAISSRLEKIALSSAAEWVEAYRMGGSAYTGTVTLNVFATSYFRDEKCLWWGRENARREGREILVATRKQHYANLVNHILSRFGDVRLESLHPPDISQWLYALPYSSQTKVHIHNTLKIVLNDAYRERLIYFDPRQHLKPPIVTHKRKIIPTIAQLRALFPASAAEMRDKWGVAHRIGIMSSTMYACGLRGGEARALKIEAINWDIGGLMVVAAWNKDGKLSTLRAVVSA